MEMDQTVKLIVDGKTYELPLAIGTEGERAIDISRLRQETGLITLDQGYGNTGSCKSRITDRRARRNCASPMPYERRFEKLRRNSFRTIE